MVPNSGLKRDDSSVSSSHTPIRVCDEEARTVNLRFEGKGGRERVVQLAGLPARDLLAWQGGGASVLGLSPAGLWKALRRLGKRANVNFTPHDLRRTYASLALDSGIDLATVQQCMGHADPRTTSQYDRRGQAARERAARGLAEIARSCYKEKP